MTFTLSGHRHIHFVGIGGIGMSALARWLLSRGYTVSGSDSTFGEQAQALSQLGASVATGHRASNLGAADLVVTSSAVPPDNPEVQSARASGIPVVKRA